MGVYHVNSFLLKYMKRRRTGRKKKKETYIYIYSLSSCNKNRQNSQVCEKEEEALVIVCLLLLCLLCLYYLLGRKKEEVHLLLWHVHDFCALLPRKMLSLLCHAYLCISLYMSMLLLLCLTTFLSLTLHAAVCSYAIMPSPGRRTMWEDLY